MMHRLMIVLIGMGWLNVGCSLLKSRNKEPLRSSAFVGEIELVNAPSNFVLIQSGGKLPFGTALKVSRDANIELRVSPERQGKFLIADIVSGKPVVGDLVVVTPKKEKKATDGLEELP